MRVLVALGGNAMTGEDGTASPEHQRAAVEVAVEGIADLVADGHAVILTHGNGPQVGNLLLKNELAAAVVSPDPLDWCVAQTQASIGMLILDALDAALRVRGIDRRPAVVVTRTLVDRHDPDFANPTKPIGRYVSESEAADAIAQGQTWQDRGRGWRRVVASPEPLQILDAAAIGVLFEAGFIVVGSGGGGIPVVRAEDGVGLRGIEAVVDKDLAAALLAEAVGADVLVIATDVENAMLRFGEPGATPIARVDVTTMRGHAAAGMFGSGSMGPKVEAALRFVERGGQRAVITSLKRIFDGAAGRVGTVVHADELHKRVRAAQKGTTS